MENSDDLSLLSQLLEGGNLTLFEDVRAYLKDATDEIEEEIQEKYKLIM